MQVDLALQWLDPGRPNNPDYHRSNSADARVIGRQNPAAIFLQHLAVSLLAHGQFLIGSES